MNLAFKFLLANQVALNSCKTFELELLQLKSHLLKVSGTLLLCACFGNGCNVNGTFGNGTV